MKLLYLVLALMLTGCSSLAPVYSPVPNQYHYNQHSHNLTTNLISNNLIYSYPVFQLEKNYSINFCAGLSDCTSNINEVKNSAIFGNFDLLQQHIDRNPLGVTKVDLHRLIYTTQGQNQELRRVSGAVFLPNIPSPKIKGIILFFHPTFFSKSSVPSYAPDKRTAQDLAAIFATQGYIVVAPDYIGMGYDKDTFHPYMLYPQINAQDGLSMLQATASFLHNNQYLSPTQILPLFVSGYSEGGGYALWYSRLYQEQPSFKKSSDATGFKLRFVAPISGAYNLSCVTNNYLFSDIGLFTKSEFNVPSSIMAARLKPALLAFTLTSYAYYNESSNFYAVFNPDFFNMQCNLQYSTDECEFGGKQLNLYQVFSQETDDFLIVNKISNAAAHKTSNGQIFSDQWNGIMPLINRDLLVNSDFRHTLANADIYYWHSEIPTALIYLQHDSVVSSYNSIQALQGMQENHSKNVYPIAVDNSLIHENVISALPSFEVDHISGFNYLFLVALAQFNQSISSDNAKDTK